MRGLLVILVAAFVASASAASTPFVWGSLYIGACTQNCCCKVCSGSDSSAYPYGLLTQSNNPTNPQVAGSSCHVPTWSDQGPINDTNSNPVLGPNKLLWSNFAVFGDLALKTAPTTCDCCQLSVDTSCAENAPTATQPDSFAVAGGGAVTEGALATIEFRNGYGLSTFDYAELRNDTYCGYGRPKYVIRSTVGSMTPNAALTYNYWTVKMPNHGCYSVCYFQQNLTTPGWYLVGNLVVNQQPPTLVSWALNTSDVLLEGNQVTITFTGVGLLSVFSDVAELRTAGGCGSGGATTSTALGTNAGLEVLPTADWCHPPVTPSITSQRPLRYIAVQYSDCPVVNRLYVDYLTWTLTLPGANTYTVCYRRNGTWASSSVTMTIPAQLTATVALTALYTATNGANWHRNSGWGGGNACVYFGVRCDALGNVVGIFLGRNNLVGTLPTNFFRGVFFNSLVDLKLDMNSISGTIPQEMGLFRNVRVIDLTRNQLTGTLPPSLLHGRALQTLYVSGNSLTGEVPYALTPLSQRFSGLVDQPNNLPPAVHYQCPLQKTVCSNQGSTAPGVFTCGYSGISEAECVIRGCCFNSQAPLTFGGTACFTRVDALYATRPPCQNGKVTCYRSD